MDDLIPELGGNLGLQLFDPVRAEFENISGFNVDHVVMVPGLYRLNSGWGAFELVALYDTLRFKRGQRAIDG